MASIVITALPEEERQRVALEFQEANRPHMFQEISVAAGDHTINYRYESDIRFGPLLYRVAVEGPNGARIMQEIGDGLFFVNHAHSPTLNRYAFNEWRGNLSGVGTSRVRVFDLTSGKGAVRYDGKHVILTGWRRDSPEFVVQQLNSDRTADWYAYSGMTRRQRLLVKKGGQQGYISSDGRYLLIVSPHELEVRLVDIETGTLLDSKSAVDFYAYAGGLKNIVPVRFDPGAPRITIALNPSPTNHGFAKALAIEIGQP